MFQSIEPESVKLRRLHIPAAPSLQFFPYIRIPEFNIITHEIIIIPILIIDEWLPLAISIIVQQNIYMPVLAETGETILVPLKR